MRHGRDQGMEGQGHLRGGRAQNILGQCLAHKGASLPLVKLDGRSPAESTPITSLLKNPRFPHLGLNTPLGFDPFLSLVEGKSSLGKLLVVVMVSTVDDNVVGCLCIVDISDVGHPLLVCLSSAVNIWTEDNVLGPTLNCPPIHKFPSGLFGRRWPVWSQYCWISLCIPHVFFFFKNSKKEEQKVTCFSCRASPWRQPPLCFLQS